MFGVRPFDFYGTTEGLWGAECEHHTGIHLFEDMTIVENVDDDRRSATVSPVRGCSSPVCATAPRR